MQYVLKLVELFLILPGDNLPRLGLSWLREVNDSRHIHLNHSVRSFSCYYSRSMAL